MLSREELAQRIYATAHITGSFVLRSGTITNEYFDKYLFESDPALLREIAEALCALLPPGVEALAGLDLGGVPLVTMMSQVSGLPARFVRKHAKEYGTRKIVEGGNVTGLKLAMIEDVVTSGGQVIASGKELRDLGCRIACVLCVIDRESGAADNLAKEGLELQSLFTMAELREAAEAKV